MWRTASERSLRNRKVCMPLNCHANFLYIPGVVTIPTQDIAWWHLPGKNGKKVSVTKAIMQRIAKLKNSEEPVRKLHKLHQSMVTVSHLEGSRPMKRKKCIELYYSYIISITSIVKCYYDQIFTSWFSWKYHIEFYERIKTPFTVCKYLH